VFRELLLDRVSGFCQLSTLQVDQLEQHYKLMVRWNKTINLTRIESEEAVERHYAESLFLGTCLPPGPLTIADVGSGAGFPGIPVAVLRPEVAVSLIESHQRKAVFLKEASRGLPNVTVIARRAEDVKAVFDWAISRAVRWKDLEKLTLAPQLALLGSEAMGLSIPLPWDENRKVILVSRETVIA
jgi:16S rRNA (guanine(527)-N(7))-methyltransferase RsmG